MRVACPIIVAASVATLACAGCSEPAGPRSVTSDDLAIKIPAIKEAAQSRDLSAAPQLVTDLESDDPAVRMYAILALRDLADEDMGYVYYADREERKPAVQRWRKWLESRREPKPQSMAPKRR